MSDNAKAMSVRITSGADGVSVFSAESGEELHGIANLSVQFEPGGLAIASAEVLTDAVEVDGAILQLTAVDPASAVVKLVDRIEFADGTSWAAPHGAASDGPLMTEVITYTGIDGQVRKFKGACLVRGPLHVRGDLKVER